MRQSHLLVELGYEVTVVNNATADHSEEEMQAALGVNLPNHASAIVTTDEVVISLSILNSVFQKGVRR